MGLWYLLFVNHLNTYNEQQKEKQNRQIAYVIAYCLCKTDTKLNKLATEGNADCFMEISRNSYDTIYMYYYLIIILLLLLTNV